MDDQTRERPCSYIDRSFTPDPQFNTPVHYCCIDGSDYVFYSHDDGYGVLSNVQFCSLIGRKRDVFECLNTREWATCSHYQNQARRDAAAERAGV